MQRHSGTSPSRGPLQALRGGARSDDDLPARIRQAIEPLPEIDDPAFAEAFDRYADCRVVLLGEASHGTSEFYRARAAITKRLVERHGFRIVAVEADWPDPAVIDRPGADRGPNAEAPPPVTRFPAWVWRNGEGGPRVRW